MAAVKNVIILYLVVTGLIVTKVYKFSGQSPISIITTEFLVKPDEVNYETHEVPVLEPVFTSIAASVVNESNDDEKVIFRFVILLIVVAGMAGVAVNVTVLV